MTPIKKYSTLFSLYIAQSVPMSFFSTVLPIIMRMEHFSLTNIALLQLMKLPWILKFFWAPLVDKHSSSHLHYKRWIIGSELMYAVTIFVLAFFNLHFDFHLMVILMVLAIAFSATQDIASDALAIRMLKKEERAYGNSMQSFGNFGGTLLGSGVLLLLYAVTGWSWVMIALGGFVLIALIPLSLFVNKRNAAEIVPVQAGIKYSDLFRFFKLPGIGKQTLLLVVYYGGILGILSLLKPYLVDLGYGLKEIAFMVGIFGTACGAAGALLGGFILKRIGNKRGLRLFALINVVAAAFFILIGHNASIYLLYVGIALLWIAYALSSVVIYTISMEKVRSGKEGTDYTLQIVITHLMGIIFAIVFGKLADLLGFSSLFYIETAIGFVVFGAVFFLYNGTQKQLEPFHLKKEL